MQFPLAFSRLISQAAAGEEVCHTDRYEMLSLASILIAVCLPVAPFQPDASTSRNSSRAWPSRGCRRSDTNSTPLKFISLLRALRKFPRKFLENLLESSSIEIQGM